MAEKATKPTEDEENIEKTKPKKEKEITKVAVIGSGAAEHALCWKLNQSAEVAKIYAIPGNEGTRSEELTKVVNIDSVDIDNTKHLISWFKKNKISLVIVGTRSLIEKGICKEIRDAEITCFGPDKEAATVMGCDKKNTKNFIHSRGIPTAEGKIFDSFFGAKEHIKNLCFNDPWLIKVHDSDENVKMVVAETFEQATDALALAECATPKKIPSPRPSPSHTNTVRDRIIEEAAFRPAPGDRKSKIVLKRVPPLKPKSKPKPAPSSTPGTSEVSDQTSGNIEEAAPRSTKGGRKSKVIPETSLAAPSPTPESSEAELSPTPGTSDEMDQKLVIPLSPVRGSVLVDPGSKKKPSPSSAHTLLVPDDGDKVKWIIIEEVLTGEEITVIAFTNGNAIKTLLDVPVKIERDEIGSTLMEVEERAAFCPFQLSDKEKNCIDEIFKKILNSLKKISGISFIGVISIEFSITSEVKVLNVDYTFGDSATSVLMPLLENECDIFPLIEACCNKDLDEFKAQIKWKKEQFSAGIFLHVNDKPFLSMKNHTKRTVVTDFITEREVHPVGSLEIFHINTKPKGEVARIDTPEGRAFFGVCVDSSLYHALRKVKSCFDYFHHVDSSKFITKYNSHFAVKQIISGMLSRVTSKSVPIGAKDAPVQNDEFMEILKRLLETSPLVKEDYNSLVKRGYFTNPVYTPRTAETGMKPKTAEIYGKYYTIGQDLVAAGVNTLLIDGAKAIHFENHFNFGGDPNSVNVAGIPAWVRKLNLGISCSTESSVDRGTESSVDHGTESSFDHDTESTLDSSTEISPEQRSIIEAVNQGAIQACEKAKCKFKGETVQINTKVILKPGPFEVYGVISGVVEKHLLVPKVIKAGDMVMYLRSNGLHMHGLRRILDIMKYRRLSMTSKAPFASDKEATFEDEFFKPTEMYASKILPLVDKQSIKEFIPIVDGGIIGSISRKLPPELALDLNAKQWDILPVFGWIAAIGGDSADEMLNTFNCGIGAIAIMDRKVSVVNEVIAQLDFCSVGTVRNRVSSKYPVTVQNFEEALHKAKEPFQKLHLLRNHPYPQFKRIAVLFSNKGFNFEVRSTLDRSERNTRLLIRNDKSFGAATYDNVKPIISNFNENFDTPAVVVCVVTNQQYCMDSVKNQITLGREEKLKLGEGLKKVKGVQIAEKLSIPIIEVLDKPNGKPNEKGIKEALLDEKYNVSIICVAGFQHTLSESFVKDWNSVPGRACISIHPSLYPEYGNIQETDLIYYKVIRARTDITGCTVFFTEAGNRGGHIIEQSCVRLVPGQETMDSLTKKMEKLEKYVYPLGLKKAAENDTYLDEWKNVDRSET